MANHHIGKVSDFPEGKGIGMKINKTPIAIFNLDGELRAILNNCPHQNYPLHPAGSERLNAGEDRDTEAKIRGEVNAETCSVRCPWHNLEWSLDDGYCEVLDIHIPTYDVEVEDDDVYLVR